MSGARETGAGRSWIWALASLALGTVLLSAVFHETAHGLLHTWRHSPSFGHGPFVVAVALVLLWFDRRALARLAPRPWPWGLALSAVAAAVAAVGTAASALVLQQLALVLALQALAVAVLGWRVARRIAFPLAFLYFAIPFGDVVVPVLRDLTARATVEILSLSGLTAMLDGYLIRLPSADYRVAEACAGLRFLLVGFAIGLLAARLFLRSWRRWAIFLVLAAALPLAANVLRASVIVILTEKGLLGSNPLWLHLTYGMGFNAVMTALLLALAFALRDAPGPAPVVADGRVQGRRLAFPAISLAAVALPALGLVLAGERTLAPAAGPDWAVLGTLPGWREAARADDGWRPQAWDADGELRRRYANGRSRVDLYIAYFRRQRQGAEVVSDANRLGAMAGWRDVGQRQVGVRLGGSDLAAGAIVSQAESRRRLTLRLYWVDGRYTDNALLAKWRQVEARLFRGPAAAAVIVVSAPYRGDPEPAATALRGFLAGLPADLFDAP